jgi:hypothetical protein
MTLAALVSELRGAQGLTLKRDIQPVARALRDVGSLIRNGDDAAAIDDGTGYTLLAAEGMLPSFVARDPWFAGYCALMVNVSDILAMGGRPLALVDVLFAGTGDEAGAVLQGLRAAAEAFAVPVVGGHTSRLTSPGTLLAAAIVGRAQKLITSFDARPGDALVAVFDLRGAYRGDSLYFDAATHKSHEALRALLPLLPELAEAALVRAGKDVSMAGIAGTLTMLCEASGVGARLSLDALPCPMGLSLARWLVTFPSFGFLLAVSERHVAEVCARCERLGLASAPVGNFDASRQVVLELGDERALFWDLTRAPLTGFGAPRSGEAP